MDIYCPRCAEPCDMDELHDADENLTYDQARRIFFDSRRGCGFLFNNKPCEKVESVRAEASSVLAELLGDDVDGIAAMMDDFDYMGMLD